ncbi:MAG: serine hydrolase domain-containing protein [Planctomycetota bacterium]
MPSVAHTVALLLATSPFAPTLAAQAPPCHDLGGLDAVAQDAFAQAPLLQGLNLRVDQRGQTVYQRSFGGYGPGQVVPIASATKTLSAAVLLSLVDDGTLSLDDPVGSWLPEWNVGQKAQITLRMCFTHSSGMPTSAAPESDASITLRQAAFRIALLPLDAAPGSQFAYGGVSMHVAGAVCEVASGLGWNALFQQRIAGPLGMTATDYLAFGTAQNPRIAGGANSDLEDYARFVAMLRQGGVFQGTRVLSQAAVDTMLTDQTSGLPVANTPHPDNAPYGVGIWLDRADAFGRTTLATAAGAFGFAGWVDRAHDASGVWLVLSQVATMYPFVQRCWGVTDVALAPQGVACVGSPTPPCAPDARLFATTWARAGQPDFALGLAKGPASSFGSVWVGAGGPAFGAPVFDLIGYLPPDALLVGSLATDAVGAGRLAAPLFAIPPGALFTLQGAWLDDTGCGTSGLRASRAVVVDVQAP